MNAAIRPRLCLIEDDEIVGGPLTERFELEGYACDWFRSGEEAMAELPRRHYDVVLSDIHLPGMSGETLYESLTQKLAPLPPYLFITGYGEIDQAVRLIKHGATDYITKPFEIEALLEKIRDLTGVSQAQSQGVQLGVSAAMRHLQSALAKLGRASSNVLITGEQGVGKETLALALHRERFPDDSRPFVAVNCGAFEEGALRSELFGHEKQGPGGTVRLSKGAFELAHGGTLFLDEIGDVPTLLQGRLLRAIQERVIVRLGGEQRVPLDLRIVCATHRDLKKLVEQGEFSDNLYYYVNVVRLHIPPLRERKEDILWLARRFVDNHRSRQPSTATVLSVRAQRMLLEYPWPGNVRELNSAIERACLLCAGGELQPEALFEKIPVTLSPENQTLEQHLRFFERQYIMRVVAAHEGRGRITRAAATLGISRKNLWERMKRLDISAGADE